MRDLLVKIARSQMDDYLVRGSLPKITRDIEPSVRKSVKSSLLAHVELENQLLYKRFW